MNKFNSRFVRHARAGTMMGMPTYTTARQNRRMGGVKGG